MIVQSNNDKASRPRSVRYNKYRPTGEVWQPVHVDKHVRIPDNGIISRAVHGQLSGHLFTSGLPNSAGATVHGSCTGPASFVCANRTATQTPLESTRSSPYIPWQNVRDLQSLVSDQIPYIPDILTTHAHPADLTVDLEGQQIHGYVVLSLDAPLALSLIHI